MIQESNNAEQSQPPYVWSCLANYCMLRPLVVVAALQPRLSAPADCYDLGIDKQRQQKTKSEETQPRLCPGSHKPSQKIFGTEHPKSYSQSQHLNNLCRSILAMIDIMTSTNTGLEPAQMALQANDLEPEVATSSVECPPGIKQQDVLCGRDRLSHSHPGNKRFRVIIEMNREAYQNAPNRETKTNLTIQIVEMIRQCDGRFLKQNETTKEWEDVGDNYAREKVSHALRSAKDPNRPKTKKKRETKKYVPTDEEEALFQETLRDQQSIFKRLIEKESEDVEEILLGDAVHAPMSEL